MIRDPLEGMLFALVHFCVFHPTATTHLTCAFPSLANDTHIIGLALYVVFFFCDYKRNLQH